MTLLEKIETAAVDAFDAEHDLWDYRKTARGEFWVTRKDEIQLTAYDDLIAEGEMHNLRDDACAKAAARAALAILSKPENISDEMAIAAAKFYHSNKPFCTDEWRDLVAASIKAMLG